MKHIILLFLITPMILAAQSVDMDRMNRDLKVAENGLKSLVDNSNVQDPYFNILRLNNQRLGSQFIKEYGVIIDAQICEPCLRSKKNKKGDDFSAEDVENHLIDASKTFLADYASIIGQLNDNQNIMIKFSSSNSSFRNVVIAGQAPSVISLDRKEAQAYQRATELAEVRSLGRRGFARNESGYEIKIEASVADINNLLQGNLSRDAFLEKVKVEKVTISNEADPQLETFVAMFHRLYQNDLSSTYYMSSRPKYSKISDVGVMIHGRVYSSNSMSKDKYDMPTIQKKGLTLEQRNVEVQKMLPQFEKEFKENIINYARTIRSENKDQAIIFDIRLTQCEDCKDFPKYIKFSVNQNVLDQFNKGKLNFDQAVAKVTSERRSA